MILVTGATGIVGSHIIADLVEKTDAPIRALVRSSSDRSPLHRIAALRGFDIGRVEFVDGDVGDPVSIEAALKGCSQVYHTAALVSFRKSDARRMIEINMGGTANVVNAALAEGVAQFCHISSTAAMGDEPIDGMIREESQWDEDRPRSDYSLSKRLAELEVERARQEGLKAVIVNPSVIIGPGQWGKSSTTLVETAAKSLRFYPSGSNGFVDARDVSAFSIHAMDNKLLEGRYLLVGENATFHQLFSTLATALGTKPPTIPFPRGIARSLTPLVRFAEAMGLPLAMSSENLKSAYRQVRYANQHALETGFQFRGLEEMAAHVASCYRLG